MGHPERRSDDGNGKFRPTWSPSITLGGLLNLGAIIVSVVLAYSSLKETVSVMAVSFKGEIAVLNSELAHIKSWIAELKADRR